MLGLPPGDTDPMLDGMSDGEPEFEEPMELVDARARLAQLAHAQGGEALAGEGMRRGAARRAVLGGSGLGWSARAAAGNGPAAQLNQLVASRHCCTC